MFETSDLFKENINSTADVLVHQGGSSSGKTYSILHTLFYIALREPGTIITIVAESIPKHRAGALRDAETIIAGSPELQGKIATYNKSQLLFEFKNGSIMEFKSYESEQGAKSGKRDYLFINEADGISWEIYTQLYMRTKKRTFIDYNPTAEFWVHEKVIGQTGVQLIISDHRHNPFCPAKISEKIEGLLYIDKELWKVYARGKTGKIEGLIFPNYTIIEEVPEGLEHCYGMDFGFNHPSTCMQVSFDEDKLYWDEIIYKSGLITADLIELLRNDNVQPNADIWADSARPDTIEEIHKAGFNIYPADKSVKDGINAVKAKKLFITRRSVNTIKEIRGYKWKVDKNGKALDEPVKFMDDAMDAGRYGTYNGLNKPKFDYDW